MFGKITTDKTLMNERATCRLDATYANIPVLATTQATGCLVEHVMPEEMVVLSLLAT